MIRAAFASMVMYFEEREAAHELQRIRQMMEDVVLQFVRCDPNSTLKQWGALIKAKFDADNLRMYVDTNAPFNHQVRS
jgi:hypothetical protein